MLDKDKCEQVLSLMNSMDLSKRVEALNKAREMFHGAFTEGMTLTEYAYSATVIEQFYNIIRTELKVDQIRVKRDVFGGKEEKTPKKSTKKKVAPAAPDFSSMMGEFTKFVAKQKAEGNATE